MRTQLLAATAILAMTAGAALAQVPVPSDQTTGQILHGTPAPLANGQPATPTGTIAGGTNPNWPTGPVTDQTNAQIQHGTPPTPGGTMGGTVTGVSNMSPSGSQNSAATPSPMPSNGQTTGMSAGTTTPMAMPTDTTQAAPAAMPAASQPAATADTTTTTSAPPPPMVHSAFVPGHEAMSMRASNISAADTTSEIAPALPQPPVGPDATANDLLKAAQAALDKHHSGEAQEALERAETRLLDRSTAPDAAGSPDQRPRVSAIAQARDAIGRRDWPAAHAAIDSAMRPGEGG